MLFFEVTLPHLRRKSVTSTLLIKDSAQQTTTDPKKVLLGRIHSKYAKPLKKSGVTWNEQGEYLEFYFGNIPDHPLLQKIRKDLHIDHPIRIFFHKAAYQNAINSE